MPRIVHLGLGGFHRAHQAIYAADAAASLPDGASWSWEICGVSLRSPRVVDAMCASGGRYSLVGRGPVSDVSRSVSVHTELLFAAVDADAAASKGV